jgi:Kef-type K+ transport system membrane component KefB
LNLKIESKTTVGQQLACFIFAVTVALLFIYIRLTKYISKWIKKIKNKLVFVELHNLKVFRKLCAVLIVIYITQWLKIETLHRCVIIILD